MEIGKRMDEIDALLKNFGAALSGFDPGVTAYFLSTDKNPKGLGYQGAGAFGEPLSFSRVAWQWLEPLLIELRQARRANAAEKQCAEFAAANLAANKRIVELEHERDKERSKVDALLESSALLRGERDAARAELARLTTPRPIAEAPRDGTWVLGYWDETTRLDAGCYSRFLVVQWLHDEWLDEDGDELNEPSHYLPLPEVKP